ncbi:unnamed protein product [Hymenolepis diminuta]|uniref:U6 snRNA-associated Sm-like protein LSm1 n=1 Tax=Hymenolepis diminuta TaxID=6216 RepID=A0A0R3SRM2_HYMDI|nr:unnamed protein product [Hymenolepis diminuta]
MLSLGDVDPSLTNFPGSASLINDLGKRMLVKLRGHKCYIGYLRSIDQFGKCIFLEMICTGTILLSETCERIFVGEKYSDVRQGLIVIKGENIALIGEMKEDETPPSPFEKVSEEEIFRLQAELIAERREANKRRQEILSSRGIDWLDQDLFDDP